MAPETDADSDNNKHSKTHDAIVGPPKTWSLSWLLANRNADLSPAIDPTGTPVRSDASQAAHANTPALTKNSSIKENANQSNELERSGNPDASLHDDISSQGPPLVAATVSTARAEGNSNPNRMDSVDHPEASKRSEMQEIPQLAQSPAFPNQTRAIQPNAEKLPFGETNENTADLIKNPAAFDRNPKTEKSRVAPVAISAVPAKLHRQGNKSFQDASQQIMSSPAAAMSMQGASFQQNAANAKSGAIQQFAPNVKRIPLFMKRAQVRSITVDGELSDIRISNTDVCQAVLVSPSRLKLIAAGDGIAEMVVWAKTGEDQSIRMRIFRIHVESVDPSVAQGGRTIQLLHGSIRNAFPNCDVTISHEGGDLVVTGRCTSREAAEKIIRMVRSTCLVTVHDRLSVD